MAESFSVKAILSAVDSNFSSVMNKAMGTSRSLGDTIKGTALGMGMFKAAGAAVNAFTANLDSAIGRYDTMNNFPKIMGNLGISAAESGTSINKLSNKLTGLPTTLDSAARGVTNFTSKNGDIKKSTDYFLALNNAVLAGGQSTAIQGTAFEQLSQSYAKGKMDMMEWRSLQTAMPAQLKQVATAMGISTDQLGEGLRNGTVSMDAFMDTIVQLNEEGVDGFASFAEQAKSATGGIETAITNMKTSVVRGITDCIGSIDSLLVQNGFPTIGEMAIVASGMISRAFSKISNAIEGLDLVGFIQIAEPYWNTFSDVIKKVADSCGEAFGAIVNSLGDFLSKQSTIDTVTTVIETLGDAISKLAGFVANNSDVIVGAIPYIVGFGLAFKGIKGIWSIASGIKNFLGITKKVPDSTYEAGQSVTSLKDGFNSLQKSAGIALIVASLALLASALVPLASLGTAAVPPLIAFGAVIAGLGIVFAQFGAKLQSSIGGIVAFAASISIMALAMAPIASTGTEGAIAMAAFGVVVGALVAVFAIFGTALTVAIPAMLAFGATILMVGAGMALASVLINALTPFVEQFGNTISQVASAISSAVSEIMSSFSELVSVVADAVSQIVQSIGNTLVDIIKQAGESISGVVDSISNGFEQISDGIATVVDSISGGFTSVLEAVADVIRSIGDSAKNAGTGFKSVAEGISMIAGLSILDIGKALGTVAVGIGEIAGKGADLQFVADGLNGITASVASASVATQVLNNLLMQMEILSSTVTASITALSTTFAGLKIPAIDVGPMIAAFAQIVVGAQVMANGVKSSLLSIQTGYMSAFTQIGAAVQNGMAKVTSLTQNGMNMATSKMKSGMSVMRSTVQSGMNTIASATISGMAKYVSALRSGMNRGRGVASSGAAAIVAALNSASSGAYSCGYNIGIGLANGMSATLGMVQSVAAQLAAAAEAAVRARAQIHSPSRLFEKLGNYVGEGFADGIDAMVKSVSNSSENMVSIPSTVSGPDISEFAYGGSGAVALDERYAYNNNATYTIIVPVEIEGREVAKATAIYTQEELERLENRNNRRRGDR